MLSLYKCPLCNKIVERESNQLLYQSFCEETGQDAVLVWYADKTKLLEGD